MKTKLLIFPAILMLYQGKAQSLKLLDTAVNLHRIDFCELVKRYIDTPYRQTAFTHYLFQSHKFYGIKFKRNWNDLLGEWGFVMKNDTLNQYGFSSRVKEISYDNYIKYFKTADSAITYFTDKYGLPARDTSVNNLKNIRLGVRKAMWLINGQKLLVRFVYDHEFEEYIFEISRYEDYYGDFELPPEFDGY